MMQFTAILNDPKRRRQVLKAAMAILCFQLVFWLLINPIGSTTSLPPESIIRSGEVTPLPEPSRQAFDQARFEAVDLTWSGCCDHRFYGMRYRFDLDQLPTQDFGIILSAGWDNLRVFMNGHLVRAQGTMTPLASYHGQHVRLDRIPAGLMHQGENSLEIITARNKLPYTDFRPFVFFDYSTLEALTSTRFFVINDLKAASAFMAGLIAAIAMILLPQTRNKRLAFWLMAVTGFYCLRTSYYFWDDTPLGPATRMLYYFVITNALALSWLNFIDSWTGRPWPKLWLISTGLYGVLMASIAFMLFRDPASGFDWSAMVTDSFIVLCGLATVARFGWHFLRHNEDRIWEVAAFSLCIAGILVDAYYEFFYATNVGMTYKAAPFLLFALVVAIASRNIRLYESMASFNTMLNRKIDHKESEIRQRYEELQAEQKARTLAEERQRILRDMHDGIGHKLVGLLLQARARKLTPQAMEQGLETSLNDLRLVVDSLDQEEITLAQAMAMMRERIAPQAEAAEITLSWESNLPDTLRTNPRQVLQIGRILQEAITNALRHAGTDTIAVQARHDNDMLRIEVRDRGCGFKPDKSPAGRGLTNMRSRAKALGGTITIEPADPGTLVIFTLPDSVSS